LVVRFEAACCGWADRGWIAEARLESVRFGVSPAGRHGTLARSARTDQSHPSSARPHPSSASLLILPIHTFLVGPDKH